MARDEISRQRLMRILMRSLGRSSVETQQKLNRDSTDPRNSGKFHGAQRRGLFVTAGHRAVQTGILQDLWRHTARLGKTVRHNYSELGLSTLVLSTFYALSTLSPSTLQAQGSVQAQSSVQQSLQTAQCNQIYTNSYTLKILLHYHQ